MLPTIRLLGGALAGLLPILVLACDAYPQPQDPSSAASSPDPASSAAVESLEQELHAAQAKLEAARAAGAAPGSRSVADVGAHTTPQGETRISNAAPLAPFTSGGEERIECPAGFLAEASADTGCACVATESGTKTIAPFAEAPCSTTGRAEAAECIFTCSVPSE